VGSRSKARARAQASQVPGQRSAAPRPPASGRAAARTAAQPPQPSGSGQDQAAGPVITPATVRVLAAIVAVEAVGVLYASVLAALDTGGGKAYQLSSGIAITVIGACTAAGLGLVARSLRSGRRWTRTPALLTQLFTGIVGIYMVQAPRYSWGIPALLLAVAGFAMLFAPASMQVLTPGRPDQR
jgi:hypothetical protein